MKVKDLITKLAALNPEAEVYVWEHESWEPLKYILRGHQPYVDEPRRVSTSPLQAATPPDTLIVLSE